ncbi:MAG TPA: hypothetical protein P5079_04980, partial [Elusimicrobiota bacterium]|nr:hypothetical protein [Elusimicrobiota bacterium]
MRITNLHLIFSFFFLSAAGFFAYRHFLPSWTSLPKAAPAVPALTADMLEQERRSAEERKQLAVARERAEQSLRYADLAIETAQKEERDATAAGRAQAQAKGLFGEAQTITEFNEVTRLAEQAADLAMNAVAAAPSLLDRYITKAGDNLWNISKRPDVYGRGAGWVKIWRANEKQIPDFDVLYF